MIGKIVVIRDEHIRSSSQRCRMCCAEIVWEMCTVAGQVDESLRGYIRYPSRSTLPGIHGKLGDTIEITVRVIPKDPKESEETDES